MSSGVSVVIPTYNRGSKIESTLDSVISQTLAPLEILVIDDGSLDGTGDWIASHYGEQVRVIRQANQGVAAARNRGLQEAKGDYIAFLDHDDIWLPHKLELQIRTLQQTPKAGLIYCDWVAINDANTEISKPSYFQLEHGWTAAQGRVTSWLFASHAEFVLFNPIISMSVPLIRTELLTKIGGFDSTTVPSDDWDLWIRLSKETEFAYCNEICVQYRFHEGQQHSNSLSAFNSFDRIITKHQVSQSTDIELWKKQSEFKQFVRKFQNHFLAKEALFNRNFASLLKYLIRQVFISPAFAVSKQHIYLLARAVRLNTARY